MRAIHRTIFHAVLPAGLAVTAAPLMAQTDSTRTDSLEAERTPGIVITQDQLDAELSSQDVSGLLQASRDVFTSVAGYNLGGARFRIRGLDPENTLVSINGVVVNDLENGWAPWSQWGGLNDITRWMEVHTGIAPSRYNFGGVGGWSNIDTRASSIRRGTRVSYALSNRAYRNRLMATYGTGMMKNGWAFAASASHRWAGEGYVDGTFFYGTAYYLAAEKKLNEKHRLGLSAFGVNLQQGRQGIATAEAQTLTSDNFYNPYWGYQNGEKRNARVSHDHKPMVMLTHTYAPDSSTSWTTSGFVSFGRDGLTNLNWYDAKDPRPDYYRNLPSYYALSDPYIANQLTTAWQNDVNTQQIDWDQLYFANSKNLYSVENANGITGNTITGLRSKYIVEDVRDDLLRTGLNTAYTKALDERTTLTLGGHFQSQRNRNYKLVEDLLGGDFWVDVDQFAEQDFADPNAAQSDLNNPNRVVYEGDEFGFKYDLNTLHAGVFGQVERRGRKWEGYGALNLTTTSFWREGYYMNGLFPENSYGDSEKQSFVNVGIKGGVVYKLSGRHYLSANAAYLTRPPATRNAFLSPRTRDVLVDGLTSEQVLAGDVNYQIRAPKVKARFTAFYVSVQDQVWTRSFYHEDFRTLVNYAMSGVDNMYTGIEFGAEVKASPTVVVNGVFTTGQYIYDSRPLAQITRDNSTAVLADDRVVYFEGYHIGGMPQTAASAGVRYNSPKFWSVGVNGNWFANTYLDPNPDRRTSQALGNLVTEDPQWDQLLDQEEFDDSFTLDLFAMKSWMVQRKYRIAVNLSVSNVLDDTDIRTGGFEQMRYDRTDVNKFPPKYSYMYGRTFFAMLTFSF